MLGGGREGEGERGTGGMGCLEGRLEGRLEGLKYWILRSYKLSLSLGLDTIVSNLFDGIDLLLAKGLVRGGRAGQYSCSSPARSWGRTYRGVKSSHDGVGRLGCR